MGADEGWRLKPGTTAVFDQANFRVYNPGTVYYHVPVALQPLFELVQICQPAETPAETVRQPRVRRKAGP